MRGDRCEAGQLDSHQFELALGPSWSRVCGKSGGDVLQQSFRAVPPGERFLRIGVAKGISACQNLGMPKGAGPGSSMVRRQLGRRLRRLREQVGKTLIDVEAAQIASVSKMYRMELGKTAVKAGDILALARLYGLGQDVTDDLMSMARRTRDDGWFEPYVNAVPEWLGLYADLEKAASQILLYHPELAVDLVQSADYARAILATDLEPDGDLLEKRVAFRLERQKAVFAESVPGKLKVVLGSGVMSLVVGSPEVSRAQLEHLRKLDSSGLVEIRIRPWTAGSHADLRGAFTLLEFADPDDPDLVHLDTYLGPKYLEEPDEVQRFRNIFSMLVSTSVPIEEYLS